MKSLQYLALGSALSFCALAFEEVTTTHHATTSKPATSKSSISQTANATTFHPKTCVKTLPTANPTAHFTLTSGVPTPVTVGMYTPAAGGKASLQLVSNGTRYLYSVVSSKSGKSTIKGVSVLTNNLGSFILNSDGTFQYIAQNCSTGLTGTLPVSSVSKTSKTAKKTTTQPTQTPTPTGGFDLDLVVADLLDARVAPPGDGEPKTEVDLLLVNQCAQLLPGQSPHLKCLQNLPGGANSDQLSSPVSDFVDKGNGLYVGVCETVVDIENLCLAGEAACSALGQFLIDNGLEAACGLIAGLSGNPVIITSAVLACKFIIEQGLSKFCKAEGLDGDFSKCQAAAVTPVLSMSYLPGNPYRTESTLATISGQFAGTSTISPTVTAMVPSCTVKGNPYPSAQAANCPYDNQLTSGYVLCNSCYESGIPWEAGQVFDIGCETCCSCCGRSPAGGPPANGPSSTCCPQPQPGENPNCSEDICYAELDYGKYQRDCNVVTVEELCTNPGYDYGHPDVGCTSPDFASLFNPNSTFNFNQSYCAMGYPPPEGFVDFGSVSS